MRNPQHTFARTCSLGLPSYGNFSERLMVKRLIYTQLHVMKLHKCNIYLGPQPCQSGWCALLYMGCKVYISELAIHMSCIDCTFLTTQPILKEVLVTVPGCWGSVYIIMCHNTYTLYNILYNMKVYVCMHEDSPPYLCQNLFSQSPLLCGKCYCEMNVTRVTNSLSDWLQGLSLNWNFIIGCMVILV